MYIFVVSCGCSQLTQTSDTQIVLLSRGSPRTIIGGVSILKFHPNRGILWCVEFSDWVIIIVHYQLKIVKKCLSSVIVFQRSIILRLCVVKPYRPPFLPLVRDSATRRRHVRGGAEAWGDPCCRNAEWGGTQVRTLPRRPGRPAACPDREWQLARAPAARGRLPRDAWVYTLPPSHPGAQPPTENTDLANPRMNGWTDGRTEGRTDRHGRTDGRMDGWADGRRSRQTDRWTNLKSSLSRLQCAGRTFLVSARVPRAAAAMTTRWTQARRRRSSSPTWTMTTKTTGRRSTRRRWRRWSIWRRWGTLARRRRCFRRWSEGGRRRHWCQWTREAPPAPPPPHTSPASGLATSRPSSPVSTYAVLSVTPFPPRWTAKRLPHPLRHPRARLRDSLRVAHLRLSVPPPRSSDPHLSFQLHDPCPPLTPVCFTPTCISPYPPPPDVPPSVFHRLLDIV